MLLKMIKHLDRVWWGGCGADPPPLFFKFFYAPSLYVSKTSEITSNHFQVVGI